MVYLAYTGMQDMFLTESPSFSHFRTVYVRDLPSTMKTVEQPFDQTSYRPGDTLVSTIRQNGDYITGISLRIKFPQLTPNSSNWIYSDPPSGYVYGYYSNNVQAFTITMLGLTAKTTTTSWFLASPSGSVTVSVSGDSKFVFTASSPLGYIVFSSTELANFWGYVFNPTKLFGGYVRFVYSPSDQVTFQESGWLQGDDVYNQTYSYLDDTVYKMINSVGMYIGRQLIQEFDSTYIKFYKDTNTSYKNRPVLKLLEGNDNIVDYDRFYYFELPFIDVPVHAIPRHDVQIYLKTNPFNYVNFYASLVINFNTFSQKLPANYIINVPQVTYFNTEEKLNIKGCIKKLVITGAIDYEVYMNGEFFTDDTLNKTSAFENLENLPTESNVIVFNNMINMSRVREQIFKSSNVNVYAETLNIMKISSDMAGLMFDFTDPRPYPLLTGNFTNPFVQTESYLFNNIQSSVPLMLSFYSMRRVSPGYTGPVIRLRVGSTEEDFYTDSTQSYLRTANGTSVADWSSGYSDIYVVIWYDQFLYFNHIYQDDEYYQPTLYRENNGTYVIKITNQDAMFIPPQQYLKLSSPLKPQQIMMHINRNTNTSIPIISNSSEYQFRLQNGNIQGDNSSKDWINFPGAGTVYWRNNNLTGSTLSLTNTNISAGTWTVFTTYASSMPLYDTTIGGAMSDVMKRQQFFNSDQTFSGRIFELGFLTGTSMSTDGSTYFSTSKIIS